MAMKAYAQKRKGGPEVLEVLELPKPTPTGHDLLVKVIATATNPVDGKVRSGEKEVLVDPPKILGWDAAGLVEEIGDLVTTHKKGDEVYFAGNFQRQGANAEYALVDERITGRKPKSLNWEQAATVPLCALTSWEGLVEGISIPIPVEGGINPNANKTLLVVGGSGGVGSITIQIAKKVLKIGRVVATASRPETIDWCKKMGADLVIPHQNLKAELAKVGVDRAHYIFVTVDMSSCYDAVIDAVRPCGKIVGITGFSGLDTSKLFWNRITLCAELMFSRSVNNEEPEKQAAILNTVGDLLDKGVLVHTHNHHFEWAQLREAQKFQDSGKAIGKIGLTVKF